MPVTSKGRDSAADAAVHESAITQGCLWYTISTAYLQVGTECFEYTRQTYDQSIDKDISPLELTGKYYWRGGVRIAQEAQ
jgi:hypothetical protein